MTDKIRKPGDRTPPSQPASRPAPAARELENMSGRAGIPVQPESYPAPDPELLQAMAQRAGIPPTTVVDYRQAGSQMLPARAMLPGADGSPGVQVVDYRQGGGAPLPQQVVLPGTTEGQFHSRPLLPVEQQTEPSLMQRAASWVGIGGRSAPVVQATPVAPPSNVQDYPQVPQAPPTSVAVPANPPPRGPAVDQSMPLPAHYPDNPGMVERAQNILYNHLPAHLTRPDPSTAPRSLMPPARAADNERQQRARIVERARQAMAARSGGRE